MSLGGARELLATFGFKVETHELKHGENALEAFLGNVKKFAGAVAGAFVAHEIFEFAETSVKAMASIEHSSARLGISTEQVQAYTFAAKSLGLESETLLNMMGRLQVAQAQAAAGTGKGAQAFAKMGVSTKDASGQLKDADAIFRDVAVGIGKIKDPAKQAAAAQELFGRGGRQLLPILKEGGEGLEELLDLYKQLGGGYTEKAIEESKKFEKQQARLNLVMTALRSKAMEVLLPVLTKVTHLAEEVAIWFSKLTKETDIVTAAFRTFATVAGYFAAQMIIANIPTLALIAGLILLGLIFNSIVRLFEGKQSAIGDAIDTIFGKNAHLEVVKAAQAIWHEIASDARELAESIQLITRLPGQIGNSLGIKNVTAAERDYAKANPNSPSVREDRKRLQGGLPSGLGRPLSELPGAAYDVPTQPQDWVSKPLNSFDQRLHFSNRGDEKESDHLVNNHHTNSTMNQHNTFNIHGGDPHAISDAIAQHLADVKANAARKAVNE